MRHRYCFFALILFLAGCGAEQAMQIEERRDIQLNEYKHMNQHYLERPVEDDDDNYILDSRGKFERNMVMNEYFEDGAIDLSKWQEMDQRIRDGFDELRSENPDANWYYDLVLNAYSMLHKYLNRLELTTESAHASEYYLDLLMENEAPDLGVLAPALSRLRHHLAKDKFDVYRARLLQMAQQEVVHCTKQLERLRDEIHNDPFLEKAVTHRSYERRLRMARRAINTLS